MCDKINHDLAAQLLLLAREVAELKGRLEAMATANATFRQRQRAIVLQDLGLIEDTLGIERTKTPNRKRP